VDLKGVIYDATVVASYALLVVNVGPSEAKVEAVMNDFVQVCCLRSEPLWNVRSREEPLLNIRVGFALQLRARATVAEVERQAFEFGDDADPDEDDSAKGGKRKKKGAVGANKKAKKGVEAVRPTLPSNSPHDHMMLRVELVGSHGRWKRPCLQTAHMTIWYWE
jgi:hypothetical protein